MYIILKRIIAIDKKIDIKSMSKLIKIALRLT